jgi:hypothetical protein
MTADPDLVLDGLSIWVLDREFPEATNGWDEEWLSVRATMRGIGSSVTTEGMILMTTDFKRFRDQLATLHAAMGGEACLSGYEPNLKVTLSADKRGGVPGQIEITADHLSESHRFEIGIDQSYLPALVASCDAILERFPVIGRPRA